jgi:AbrB family looped-hinge helix DNA binding protein
MIDRGRAFAVAGNDNGRINAMITTIDAAGRLVLPKAIRERAELTPGAPIQVRVVDGKVELEPACAAVTIEHEGGLWVAAPASAMPVLTQGEVDRTVAALRVPAGRASTDIP